MSGTFGVAGPEGVAADVIDKEQVSITVNITERLEGVNRHLANLVDDLDIFTNSGVDKASRLDDGIRSGLLAQVYGLENVTRLLADRIEYVIGCVGRL